jgi:vitamin B12 transporter
MSPETGLREVPSLQLMAVRGRTVEPFNMRQSIAGPLGLVVLAFSPLLAAGELTEVVVTANRLAEPEAQALASVSLFTRADIQSRQARSLEDLLAGADGVVVGNNGGPGKLTSLFVRGTEADQLLVLVDGVRIGSATAGTAAVQNLPVEMIDRVELVRGPRSSLYGADAIGGVLQVFTRHGGGDWRPDASISGGSFDTRQLRAHVGGGSERAWLQLEGSWEHTRGFDACRGSSTAFAGCYTEEPDRDGYRYRSASLRAGGMLGTSTTVDANLLRAGSEVEFDGSFTNRSRLLQQVAGVGITQALDGFGSLALHLGSARDRSRDYHDDSFNGFFETRRDSASLQWDVQPAIAHTFTMGVDFLRDHVDSTTDYTVDSRDDLGVFTQYVAGIGHWRLEGSLRGDDNEQFGTHGTGAAALGYAFNDALQVLAQYGTGFKAPTFNDLYYPADPVFGPASNENLKPERSRSVEIAVRGMLQQASWRVSLYHTRIRDLIGLDANYLPANIDDARIRGVEASGRLALQGWNIEAGATLQDAEDRGEGASRGRQLPRRPRIAGNVDVSRRVGSMTLGARWLGQGHRFDDADGTRPLDGYGTLDLRAEAPLSRSMRLQLRAANVLDKRYETVAWYNQPGRALYFTLRYEPAP